MTADYARDAETANRAAEQLALAVLELSALEALYPRHPAVEIARNKAVDALEYARFVREIMHAD